MAYTSITDFVLDQLFGYQDANEIKDNIEATIAARLTHFLGGSRQIGTRSASYVDAPEYVDIVLDGTNLGGLTKQARIDVRTANTGTAVTVRVRNVTDSTDAGESTAYSTDTNWKAQTITLTIATGVKTYRLQIKGANDDADVFAKGYVEIYA